MARWKCYDGRCDRNDQNFNLVFDKSCFDSSNVKFNLDTFHFCKLPANKKCRGNDLHYDCALAIVLKYRSQYWCATNSQPNVEKPTIVILRVVSKLVIFTIKSMAFVAQIVCHLICLQPIIKSDKSDFNCKKSNTVCYIV